MMALHSIKLLIYETNHAIYLDVEQSLNFVSSSLLVSRLRSIGMDYLTLRVTSLSPQHLC